MSENCVMLGVERGANKITGANAGGPPASLGSVVMRKPKNVRAPLAQGGGLGGIEEAHKAKVMPSFCLRWRDHLVESPHASRLTFVTAFDAVDGFGPATATVAGPSAGANDGTQGAGGAGVAAKSSAGGGVRDGNGFGGQRGT